MNDQNQHIQEDQLQAYLDGALESTSMDDLQAHLESCSTCQAQLDRLEAVMTRLEAMPEIDLQRDLSQLVIEQIKKENAISPAITWTLVVEAIAAGAVIGALIPALQAAGWLPRILEIKLSLQAGLNNFLAQLSSTWLVWWAGLKLQISHTLASLLPMKSLSMGIFSPWILVGMTGVLIIAINALLLGRRRLPEHNHHQLQT